MSPPSLEALLAREAEMEADLRIAQRAYQDECAKNKRMREHLLALATEHLHCACGMRLELFTGAGATGLLCPVCDAPHADELEKVP